jgi:hypothetical protein
MMLDDRRAGTRLIPILLAGAVAGIFVAAHLLFPTRPGPHSDRAHSARPSPLAFEVPLTWSDDGQPCISVLIGTTKVRLLLDTGAQSIHLRKRCLTPRDYRVVRATTTTSWGNTYPANEILLPLVRIGGRTLTNVTGRESDRWDSEDHHGLLGVDLLQGLRVTIDPFENTVVAESSPAPESGDWTLVPLLSWKDGDVRYYFATLKSPSGAEALLYVDSGANISFMDGRLAEEIAGTHVQKKADASGLTKIDVTGFTLGNLRVEGLSIAVLGQVIFPHKDGEHEPVGVLGADFFAKYKVSIHLESHSMYVEDRRPRALKEPAEQTTTVSPPR